MTCKTWGTPYRPCIDDQYLQGLQGLVALQKAGYPPEYQSDAGKSQTEMKTSSINRSKFTVIR